MGVHLDHLLECIDLIESYVADIEREEFSQNLLVQDAVLRRVEIIGEAVKNLPRDLWREDPQVPWRKIAGTRDKLSRDYLGVDAELIWNVVQTLIPELRAQVQGILEDLPRGEWDRPTQVGDFPPILFGNRKSLP